MNNIIDELKTYPEIKTYILVNNFTNEERIVTEKMLINAFGETEYNRIRTGRNDYWLLIDN